MTTDVDDAKSVDSIDDLHLQYDTKVKNGSDSEEVPSVDGGWGWMIVLGCFLMNFILAGIGRSYGILYVELRTKFGSSSALTAWVGGLHNAVRMSASPVASALCNRFSVRSVTTVGGFVYGVSICICAFTPSTEFLFLPYSIIAGVAGSMVYVPLLVMVGKYFDKRRGMATGLGTAGSGFGVFVIPVLFTFLFDYYGLSGTLLLMGGFGLNLAVCGALMRPLKENYRNVKDKESESGVKFIGFKTLGPKSETHKSSATNTCNKSVHIAKDDDINQSQVILKYLRRNNDDNQCREAHSPDNYKKKCYSCNLSKYLDYSLLCDPIFLGFAIALAFITMSYMAAQMLLTDLAISRGIDNHKSVLLLSILGLSDLFGRISSGFLFDLNFIKRHREKCYNLAMLISAVTCFAWSVCSSFNMFVMVTITHGLFNGTVVSQRAVIASDLLGVHQLGSSFGLTVFFQGIGLMIGPALAGLLRDITAGYQSSYLFCGSSGFFAALIFFFRTKVKHQDDKIVDCQNL